MNLNISRNQNDRDGQKHSVQFVPKHNERGGGMTSKRILSFLLCICILCGLIPSQVMAANQTGEPSIEEQANSIGELGGYLAGNALTAAKLFAERKFTQPGGRGFAAERGNNLIDCVKGLNASVVGDDNAANGPDRKIINRDGSIT